MVEGEKSDKIENEKRQEIIKEYEEDREDLVQTAYELVMQTLDGMKHSEAVLVLEMAMYNILDGLKIKE